ncbi:MAG TPA: dispase autolysis-inducing protein [Thermoanaerobaculia bacterium]|nr:dispase autolysis-inducing protein [Thermoanaerobaculia bacterium]
MCRRFFVILLLLVSAVPAVAARRRATTPRDAYPPCSMIIGTPAVTFTRNEGLTLASSTAPRRPIAHTYGLAAMIDEPHTLVALHDDDLLISKDDGCSWRVETTIEGWDFPPQLTPARGGRVYVWSENRSFLVRYDARGAAKLKQPVDFIGLAVDANNADRLRAGGTDGSLWESVDAGESWNPLGRLATSVMVYRFTFDPQNLDHIVAGTVSDGAFVTRDAGRNWTKAAGIERGNVFHLVFSDANRVWAMGIDLKTGGKHIYASDDGGESYRIVVTEEAGVKLINGPTMAAHPANRDVLYFVFGTHVFNYGTDLFRYDDATRSLTMTHNHHDDVNAITFSRHDPSVMYLGVEVVRGGPDEQ